MGPMSQLTHPPEPEIALSTRLFIYVLGGALAFVFAVLMVMLFMSPS